MEKIICVTGPTASGKTRLAVELAKLYDGEVLSCDSMQLYRHMNIGTAKPTLDEMQGIPHHMLDVADPAEDFSVGKFVAMADPILGDILRRGKTCILAGGTGLYLDSLIAGRSFAPMPATGRREELEAMAEREGIEAVLRYLRTFDPDSADRLHPSDRKRIIRAAEVYLETGVTITEHNRRTQVQPPKYQAAWLGLTFHDRADLYRRIDRRVELMLESGLWNELEALLALGIPPTATSLQAIGYKELLAARQGLCTEDEAVETLKRESRRYAKRQLTWLRRNERIHWIFQQEPPDFPAVIETARQYLAAFDSSPW